MSIKIVIADDHLMVREGIKQLLELNGDIKVIGEADDGIQCIDIITTVNPDLLLLDVNMPNLNGLKVIEKLNELHIKVPVLILTLHNEIDYIRQALNLGVSGYVLKDANTKILIDAIYSIVEGDRYIQDDVERLIEEYDKVDTTFTTDNLTKREVEVLKLLAEGLFNKEIAYKLSISEKTVKNHVSNIFRKINVSDRTQAAVYAIKHSIVNIF